MSAKKPKAAKVPELPPPPAITDPRVQEAEQADRLARRKGAVAAVFAGRTNRLVRPNPTAADAARTRARADAASANSPAAIDRAITESRIREAMRATNVAAAGIRSFVPSRIY